MPGIQPIAAEAAHEVPIAVHLHKEPRSDARPAMEVIGVLRDQKPELSEPLEFNEGQVGGVGLDLARRNSPSRPGKAGVTPRPHAVGAAKVGDAGVSADARAREGDDVLALNDPPSNRLNVLFETPFPGHGA
jgi:hypothetical protein